MSFLLLKTAQNKNFLRRREEKDEENCFKFLKLKPSNWLFGENLFSLSSERNEMCEEGGKEFTQTGGR